MDLGKRVLLLRVKQDIDRQEGSFAAKKKSGTRWKLTEKKLVDLHAALKQQHQRRWRRDAVVNKLWAREGKEKVNFYDYLYRRRRDAASDTTVCNVNLQIFQEQSERLNRLNYYNSTTKFYNIHNNLKFLFIEWKTEYFYKKLVYECYQHS